MPYAANGQISQQPIASAPNGGVAITEQQYQDALAAILNGQEVALVDSAMVLRPKPPSPNHMWEDGEWVVPPEPGPTIEELWERLRAERNKWLRESDWVIVRNLEADEPVPQAWLDYRQALRDLPETTTDPASPDWPEQPTA